MKSFILIATLGTASATVDSFTPTKAEELSSFDTRTNLQTNPSIKDHAHPTMHNAPVHENKLNQARGGLSPHIAAKFAALRAGSSTFAPARTCTAVTCSHDAHHIGIDGHDAAKSWTSVRVSHSCKDHEIVLSSSVKMSRYCRETHCQLGHFCAMEPNGDCSCVESHPYDRIPNCSSQDGPKCNACDAGHVLEENKCKIHGEWSGWGNWSECTKKCGGGQRTRIRRCDNPSPKNDGDHCDGDSSETESCNTQTCPAESCKYLDNGTQLVKVKGKDRKVNCYDGWLIMRTDLDAGWLTDTYFTGFGKYSTNSGAIYGPSHSLIMQSNMDATRTSGWFTKSGITFGTSNDCTTITSTNNVGYYATGNYMPSPSRGRCMYWNRNCDEQSDGTCRTCKDNYGPNRNTPGTCSHMERSASSEYPFHEGNCHHWWNRFPSVTAEKPKFCLAFRNND